jgi:hypothetical protein
MTEEEKADRELGRKLSASRGDRYDATKDLYFELDPQTAARRYLFDKRSVEILGLDEWRKVAGVEVDQ